MRWREFIKRNFIILLLSLFLKILHQSSLRARYVTRYIPPQKIQEIIDELRLKQIYNNATLKNQKTFKNLQQHNSDKVTTENDKEIYIEKYKPCDDSAQYNCRAKYTHIRMK